MQIRGRFPGHTMQETLAFVLGIILNLSVNGNGVSSVIFKHETQQHFPPNGFQSPLLQKHPGGGAGNGQSPSIRKFYDLLDCS